MVQTSVPNRAGTNTDLSADNLLELFNKGYRIEVTKYSSLCLVPVTRKSI